jgi:hypothetical protein
MSIRIERVIDWHDGLVTGVITKPFSEDPWLFTLIAWSPTENIRAYGAVRITAADVLALSKEGLEWSHLLDETKRIAFDKTGAALIVVDGNTNEILSERDLQISEFRSMAKFDVAMTLDASLRDYLVFLAE